MMYILVCLSAFVASGDDFVIHDQIINVHFFGSTIRLI